MVHMFLRKTIIALVTHFVQGNIKYVNFVIVLWRTHRLKTKKICIRETPTLSTNAYSRTNTNVKRLLDSSNHHHHQWEAGIWSCDLRANERPKRKLYSMAQTYIHTYIHMNMATIWPTRPSAVEFIYEGLLINHFSLLINNIFVSIFPKHG